MASACHRCALRLQRSAQHDVRVSALRAFSSTPTPRKSLPKFEKSSNPELDTILSTLQSKYFVPGFLKKKDRRMVFSPKFKQYITENSVSAHIGDEEVTLEWMGDKDLSDFGPLVKRATKLILEGTDADLDNLVPLLQSTHEGLGKRPHFSWTERAIRRASLAGRLDIVMQLLRRSRETGISLKSQVVRQQVLSRIREAAQKDNWEEEGLKGAMKHAQNVATLLDSPEHGTGERFELGDPRTRPETIGLFLELVAVYAFKYQSGEDVSGMVKTYAERLLHSLNGDEMKVEVRSRGHQWPMLEAVRVWHGLHLALKIVGNDLKDLELAQKTVTELGAVLSTCAQTIESRNPKPNGLDSQALEAWEACTKN